MRAVILCDLEVVLGKAADDGSGFVSDIDEDVDQLDVKTEGLVVLRGEMDRESYEEKQ